MPEKRFALVVGNSQYEHATVLNNPLNDAVKMAELLERLGFAVQVRADCGLNDFGREVRNFVRRLDGADVGLFFYSGHALQFDGENYLVPVDALLEEPEDLEQLTLKLSQQLLLMRSLARVSLIFLDACRDNPFKLNLPEEADGTRRVLIRKRGLKQIDEDNLQGALVAFSAEQGYTAADGEEGELSPFTKALLEHIERPGLEITAMMRSVRQVVQASTSGKQTPWSSDSLTTEFYFAPLVARSEQKPSDLSTWHDGLEPISPTTLAPTDGQPAPRPSSPKSDGAEKALEATTRSGQLFNLAAILEAAAIKAGPLQLIFLSITAAFILLMTGYGLGFGDLQYNGKQVGQLYAPNWTLVYVVLFPPFLGLSAILAQRFNLVLAEMARRRIVVDPIGNEVPVPTLLRTWQATLRQVLDYTLGSFDRNSDI